MVKSHLAQGSMATKRHYFKWPNFKITIYLDIIAFSSSPLGSWTLELMGECWCHLQTKPLHGNYWRCRSWFFWKVGSLQEISNRTHERTDPSKTWVSNSSVSQLTERGSVWDSLPCNFWWESQVNWNFGNVDANGWGPRDQELYVEICQVHRRAEPEACWSGTSARHGVNDGDIQIECSDMAQCWICVQ